MDQMVLKTQQWMNETYGNDSRYTRVAEDGYTGWGTINGLIIALQIELGMAETAAVIGPTTRSKFKAKYPNGIVEQSADDTKTDNVHGIIQGALWCKGYYAETGSITLYFKGQTARSIKSLKSDMGIGGDSTVTMDIMECLLSMKQFVLLTNYGGTVALRSIQQQINRDYRNYTGIIPCDGLYGREMNTAIIQVLQAIEGFGPEVSNGNFGNGTKGALKVITAANAAQYPDWVWIASVAMVCNKYLASPVRTWTTTFQTQLEAFQAEYALPITRQLDVNTWMSLFVSKGNPDRAATACDTRFEITDALAQKLKADGYSIVGRYLTGGDFKEIRPGELERILSYGLKYFPIFQENGRNLSEFTYARGAAHAKAAREAAIAKGVPPTVIYFAVDLDVMDYQVDSNILPYFRGVSEHMGPMFKVGIYASRNVCTRVSNAGYAVSSFVSDMSTGYSGNLGFSIPANWNYDQFHEITGYGGSWDLDKVAYKGRVPACDKIQSYALAGYTPPQDPDTSTTAHTIFEIISMVRELEDAYEEFRGGKYLSYAPQGEHYAPQSVHAGVLNYMSKSYLKDIEFLVSVQPPDEVFQQFISAEYKDLEDSLSPYLIKNGEEVKDNIGGLNDVPHLAVSTLAYIDASIAPDYYVSWGGDLASGMEDIHIYKKFYPNFSIQQVANLFIGSRKENFPKDIKDSITVQCNYTDFCDDNDAIALSRIIKSKSATAHVLTDAMQEYYSNLSAAKRYSQVAYDGLDFSSLSNLEVSVRSYMIDADGISALDLLKGGASIDEQIAACKAFSNYLYSKIR